MQGITLTVKQRKFADNYINNGNATQSYFDAGYSVRSDNAAAVEGHKLLRNPKVILYIDAMNKAIQNDNMATMEEVHEFWASTLRDATLDLKDRIKVSELIGKTKGAFLDRVENTGGINITARWADDDE